MKKDKARMKKPPNHKGLSSAEKRLGVGPVQEAFSERTWGAGKCDDGRRYNMAPSYLVRHFVNLEW